MYWKRIDPRYKQDSQTTKLKIVREDMSIQAGEHREAERGRSKRIDSLRLGNSHSPFKTLQERRNGLVDIRGLHIDAH
jgi:hypothetical protein